MRHNAFVYESDRDFVDQMVPFLEAGFEEGASTLAVTTRRNGALLRNALGSRSAEVEFVDRDDWYVRPVRTIAAYHTKLSDLVNAGAASIRVVGEVQFGPTPEEWTDWMAYEAISNRAFADQPARIVCPYDARVLPKQVLDDAWRTHPEVLTDGGDAGGHFDEPEDVLRALAREPARLAELHEIPLGDDAMSVREHLAAELAVARILKTKALNLLLAANEIITNAFRHAGGPAMVRVGLVDGRFVCEISDRGPGFDDPLAGYLPPAHGHGSGLWVARQLTSRLELIPSADGLTVRLWA